MRIRKLRGHNRTHRAIERWRRRALSRDILNEVAERNEVWQRVWVAPWNGFGHNSHYPQPRGETRQRYINAILDVHANWHQRLVAAGYKDFYLAIWLYDRRFTESRIVCATGDWANDFGQNMFADPENPLDIDPTRFGPVGERFAGLVWTHQQDGELIDPAEYSQPRDSYASYELYEEDRVYLQRFLARARNVTPFTSMSGKFYYSYVSDDVWIGEKRSTTC